MTNEERELIHDLLEQLRVAERWAEQDSPPAEPGSSLATDNARTDPHQISHAVIYSIGVAVDHLHSMRMALTGTDDGKIGLHTYAPFTLTRGALENASAAIWMLAPGNRQERIRRRLWYELASIKQAESLIKEAHRPDGGTIQRRRDRVFGLVDAAGINRARLKGKPFYEDYLNEAGRVTELVDGETNLVYIMWKMCSAVAHGDSWMLPFFDLEMVGSHEPGVGTYRVTAPTELLHSGVRAAILLVNHAQHLLAQRSASHL
ncbi:hypothetical protein [Micromonospora sp. NPDC092111]|uniref:hypothetical protein n=1 Tax=Micromonospora sp. NPDC092111 TaxID=3364289 RepID=UPI0038089BA8